MKNILILFVLFGMFTVGCASEQMSPTTQASAEHAECLVCKKNADLACIDVTVDKTTPKYMYDGHTYYFCSEECKNEFSKNPQKYLAVK